MAGLKAHVQTKLLAGALAAIPLAITVFIFWYADTQVRALFPAVRYPFLGIAVAIAAIYALGVFVTSLVGRFLLRQVDRSLGALPGLRDLYKTWKQIAVTPDMEAGILARVVLIPDESGRMRALGFTSGRPVDGTRDTLCVFVPASPNPLTGRLYFVPAADCITAGVGAKEALKFVVSGGNYIPMAVGTALGGNEGR